MRSSDDMATFMTAAPDDDTRWKAMDQNTQAWYIQYAANHHRGPYEQFDGILLTTEYATVPGEKTMTEERLDRVLDWYRERPSPQDVLIYYMSGKPPNKLNPMMLARGASPNWRPHWMWCDLQKHNYHSQPSEHVQIRLVQDFTLLRPLEAEPTSSPQQVYYIVAFDIQSDHKALGKCLLNITTGDSGIGGLFDMAVEPEHQRKGIGTALSQYCCNLAKSIGIRYIFLNASEAGEKAYKKVGFESIISGWTWYLPKTFAENEKPTQAVVLFLDALLMGQIEQLDSLCKHITAEDLQRPTTNGLTPLELAVLCKQTEAAKWLLDHGVRPDIISLWDLDWKDDAKRLIQNTPGVLNEKAGQYGATPLHIAVERDDTELAKLLLAGPVDLRIADEHFESTPLQWAEHLQREGMAGLIKAKEASP